MEKQLLKFLVFHKAHAKLKTFSASESTHIGSYGKLFDICHSNAETTDLTHEKARHRHELKEEFSRNTKFKVLSEG